VIFVSFGANLPGPCGPPRQTVAHAARLLRAHGVGIVAASNLYLTPPVGPGRQDHYFNAVAAVETAHPPGALLVVLHRIERLCGRRRQVRWGPRTMDLDLIAYNAMVTADWPLVGTGRGKPLVVPHPLIEARSFVVGPLQDIAPDWRHPATGHTVGAMWQRLKQRGDTDGITLAGGPEWADPC